VTDAFHTVWARGKSAMFLIHLALTDSELAQLAPDNAEGDGM
jgi:hypothetical protein